jgi:hypothetical protein
MSEPAIGWIREVVLNGPDPWVLARFWAGRPSLLPGHSLATPVRWIHAVSADSFTRNLIFR